MAYHQIELDPVLYALKPHGRYQVTQAVLFYIGYFSCSYSLFAVVFTGQKVNHECAPPPVGLADLVPTTNSIGNDHSHGFDQLLNHWNTSTNVIYGKCSISTNDSSMESPCIYGMRYEKRRDFSAVSEFDLVCKRSPLMSLSQTLLNLGQGIGAMTFTGLSDRFGRKKIQVITHLLLTAGGLVLAFAPDYVTFAIFKLLVGAVQQGVVLTTVTAIVEMFPGKYRGLVAGFVGALLWTIITTSFTAWGYIFRNYSWRVLQAAFTCVGLVVITQIIFLREPLRWLLANGRTAEVVDQLKVAAKVNKVDVEVVLEAFHRLTSDVNANTDDDISGGALPNIEARRADTLALNADSEYSDANEKVPTTTMDQGKAEKMGFLDLLKHPLLRMNTLCLSAVWCINSMAYFALILMSGSLTDNIYLGFFLNTIVVVPACFLIVFLMERLGRKGTLLMFNALAAVSLLASAVLLAFPANEAVRTSATVMSVIGKLAVSGSFNMVFFYTPEIFPTNVRNLAVGAGSTAARIGAMISPFIGDLRDHVVWAPGVLFGVSSFLIMILIWRLPESVGKELPQTVRDLEMWYKSNKNRANQQQPPPAQG